MSMSSFSSGPQGRAQYAFLAMLLGADLVFILLHSIHSYTPYLTTGAFSLEQDRGHAEVFQYIKEYWIFALLFALAVRTRQTVYLGWSSLFVYLLLDDALQIHENVGTVVQEIFRYAPSPYLRPQDFGELTVSAFVGVAFLLIIAATYRRSLPPAKRHSRHLFGLLGLIVLFGVVLDLLHVALAATSVHSILGTMEDGGEMLAMSLTCWYVFGRFAQEENLCLSLPAEKKRADQPSEALGVVAASPQLLEPASSRDVLGQAEQLAVEASR